MIDRHSVDDGPCAGGIVVDHSPESGTARCCDVRTKEQIIRLQNSIEVIENNARLQPDKPVLFVDLQHPIELLRDIDDNPMPTSLSRQRSPGTPWRDGLFYAVDLLGATIGSLGLSLLVLPVWGLLPALFGVAVLHTWAILLLVL